MPFSAGNPGKSAPNLANNFLYNFDMENGHNASKAKRGRTFWPGNFWLGNLSFLAWKSFLFGLEIFPFWLGNLSFFGLEIFPFLAWKSFLFGLEIFPFRLGNFSFLAWKSFLFGLEIFPRDPVYKLGSAFPLGPVYKLGLAIALYM